MEQTPKRKRLPLIMMALLLAVGGFGVFYLTHDAQASANDDTESSENAENAENATDEDAEDEADQPAPIPVRTSDVSRGRVAAYISATANLVAENEVRVLAEWEGRLAKLNVDEGDAVGKGQVLAILAQTDGEIARNKAQVRADEAAQRHARMKRLFDQELISHDEYEKTRLDDQVAQQEVAEAEWRLEKTLIRAPFGGRVTQRMVQPGQHIRPGDELFVVTDFDPLIARIYLPESDVLSLEENRPVRITLKANEEVAVVGRIRQISPVVDTATGTVKVTVEAKNPPRMVRPGAFVRVDVEREVRADAVLVPREAVIRELQKAYVFVAKDGIAEKRSIGLGLEENGQIEATEGIEAGERVIIAGQGGLDDGASITRLNEEESANDEADAPTRIATR